MKPGFRHRPIRPRRVRLIRGRLNARREKVAAPLKRGVFLVPITITSLGLLAGFYSLISSINQHFELAAVMITVAFICDGLDGRVARASRTASQFGVEYDSLSDVVAFGVAPASLMYMWALRPLALLGWIVAGMFVLGAALRLARFNIQVGVSDKRRFVGLPVPGAAVVIAALVLAYSYFEFDWTWTLTAVSIPLTVALAGLMISRVPYPSFKSIDLRHRAPLEVVVVVLVALGFFIAVPQLMAFILATSYLLSGPLLMLKGERMVTKVPVLRPVSTDRSPDPVPAKATRSLSDRSLPGA